MSSVLAIQIFIGYGMLFALYEEDDEERFDTPDIQPASFIGPVEEPSPQEQSPREEKAAPAPPPIPIAAARQIQLTPKGQLVDPPETIQAIYLTAWSGGSQTRIDYVINLAKTTGLNAVRSHASLLGTAAGPVATVGFGWGGERSFDYATRQPALAAAVVYYGASPSDPGALARVETPVLGLYGGDDRRVNATIEAARDELGRHRKDFETHVYDGAGHGFLRQVDGRDGANREAAEKSWPVMLRFLRKHLEWIDR